MKSRIHSPRSVGDRLPSRAGVLVFVGLAAAGLFAAPVRAADPPESSTSIPAAQTAHPVVVPGAQPHAVSSTRPVVNRSLTAEEAVEIALRESPMIRGAVAEVEAAAGRLQTARAERLPAVSVSGAAAGGGSPSILTTPEGVRPVMQMAVPGGRFAGLNVTAMLPIFNGGRLQAMAARARELRSASQADLEATRQETALMTRMAYREALAAQTRVNINRAALAATRERLRIDRIALEQEKIPRYFVLRDEAEAANARQMLTDSERDLEIVMAQIRTVMGVDPSSRLALTDVLTFEPSRDILIAFGVPEEAAIPVTPPSGSMTDPTDPSAPASNAPVDTPPGEVSPPASENASPPSVDDAGGLSAGTSPDLFPAVPPVPAIPATEPVTGGAQDLALPDLLAIAESRRPELAASSRRLEAGQAEIRMARSLFSPQVGLTASLDTMKRRGMPSESGTGIGVVASLPLFDGGWRRGQVRAAQGELEVMAAERDQTVLRISQEVVTVLSRLRAAERNVVTARTGQISAEEDYRVALVRYSAGRGIVVEVLDALTTQTRAQNNTVQALLEYNIARDQLTRTLGFPALPATRRE